MYRRTHGIRETTTKKKGSTAVAGPVRDIVTAMIPTSK